MTEPRRTRRLNNIYLVGFSGTGKSRSARAVARRLGWRSVDTDLLVERREGNRIPDIFAEHGEKHFRQIENIILEQVAKGSRQVVSTGGGLAIDPANRELMKLTGICVQLTTDPTIIHRRLSRGNRPKRSGVTRPLLGRRAPLKRIKELLAAREPCYQFADGTVNTDSNRTGQIVDNIIEIWDKSNGDWIQEDKCSRN